MIVIFRYWQLYPSACGIGLSDMLLVIAKSALFKTSSTIATDTYASICVCVCLCVRACMRAWVRACVCVISDNVRGGGGGVFCKVIYRTFLFASHDGS